MEGLSEDDLESKPNRQYSHVVVKRKQRDCFDENDPEISIFINRLQNPTNNIFIINKACGQKQQQRQQAKQNLQCMQDLANGKRLWFRR